MDSIEGVLDDFCICSGEKVSVEKSSFYCSKNVKLEIINAISDYSGFTYSDNLGK